MPAVAPRDAGARRRRERPAPGRVVIRPATLADFRAYCGRTPSARCRAWIGVAPDGGVLGIGGAVFLPDGARVFLEASAEARRYPVALHKAARMVLTHLGRSGVPVVSMVVDHAWPRADAWARRLGFEPERSGSDIWLWRPSGSMDEGVDSRSPDPGTAF
ncbi:MAG TPA: hypothetical protein VJ890_28245 [Vineibacter sp.]|nr:hypothetical protein [Vineibacter sp.]